MLQAVTAMRAGDIAALGRLLDASQASLRLDFQASTPAIDTLVALSQNDPDVLGARLTGGGWGGAVLLLCRRGRAVGVAQRVYGAYRSETGLEGGIVLPAGVRPGYAS